MAPFIILVLAPMLVLVVIPNVADAQTNSNLTLGSSITAGDAATYLLSPSREFAFGFQLIGPRFLLAIWFDKIPNKTIVWSANGDNLAHRGSKVRLTGDNGLFLEDPRGKEIWKVKGSGSVFAYASMLDTGNLIVVNRENNISWDTFNNPTDTILPMQILGRGSRLVARYSRTDYSGGRFTLLMQNDGNLVLYSLSYPFKSVIEAYWKSDTMGSGSELVFNRTGQVYLTSRSGTILSEIQSSMFSTDEYYQRAVLDHDGVFWQYVYPKSSNLNAGWPKAWSTASNPVPPNICTGIRQGLGGGACGFNSYCNLGKDQKPICECPKGYIWLDPDDETKGCKQGFAPQSCDQNNPEEDQFVFEEMINTDWPMSDYEKDYDRTEDWCRQACLSDCFCAVAIYKHSTCWKKRIPFSNGKMDGSVGGKALVKVRVNNSTTGLPENKPKNKIPSPVIIIKSVLSVGFLCLNLFLAVLTFVTCKRLRSRKNDPEQQPLLMEEAGGLRRFTYQEIHEATDGFKEELGRGCFGTVYKGYVSSFFRHSGDIVAVKVLHKLTGKGDIEFKREMRAISQTNHKNLVKLLGYCNEDQHRVLVYEYMSNSCLANLLFGESRPAWHKRIEMAQGVARGLSYLHDECSTQIIHCDIKPQNVLLDDALVAKISDFGLAKLLVADQTRTLTELRGTRGYVAPESFRDMPISAKVDVFSFGILLLEIICCRKNYEPGTEDEPGMVLANWVSDCCHEGNLDPLVEDDEEASADKRRAERFVRTALWCIQEDPSLRPTMKKVTLMLEGAISVPVPVISEWGAHLPPTPLLPLPSSLPPPRPLSPSPSRELFFFPQTHENLQRSASPCTIVDRPRHQYTETLLHAVLYTMGQVAHGIVARIARNRP